jgi:hypothetical protein
MDKCRQRIDPKDYHVYQNIVTRSEELLKIEIGNQVRLQHQCNKLYLWCMNAQNETAQTPTSSHPDLASQKSDQFPKPLAPSVANSLRTTEKPKDKQISALSSILGGIFKGWFTYR